MDVCRAGIAAGIFSGVVSCSPTDLTEEAEAVRALWDEANAALSVRDWSRYEEVWFHGPTLQVLHPAQADWIDGWDVFRERYQELFASDDIFSVATRRFDVQVSPGADVAWATIEAVLTVNGVEQTHWYVMVAQKVEEQWRIVLALDAPSD